MDFLMEWVKVGTQMGQFTQVSFQKDKDLDMENTNELMAVAIVENEETVNSTELVPTKTSMAIFMKGLEAKIKFMATESSYGMMEGSTEEIMFKAKEVDMVSFIDLTDGCEEVNEKKESNMEKER